MSFQAETAASTLAKLRSFDRAQSGSKLTCFQSSYWLETWLEVATSSCELVTYERADSSGVASLAVLGHRSLRRWGLIPASSLWLWETGDSAIDRLGVEYNRPLSHRPADRSLAELVSQFEGDERYEELQVSNAWIRDVEGLIGGTPQSRCEILARSPLYWIDLAAIRTQQKDILSTLSGNTRSQVRRSIRELEQTAPLRLEFADGAEQCVEWFDLMRPMHEARWQAAGEAGAFVNPVFEEFHKKLLRRAADNGSAKMARLVHADRVLAYQYYLLSDRAVYSYQSAFALDPANKHIKPGLVAHVMAAQQLLLDGFDSYDFLGGYSQYKESLATDQGELVTLRWQKPRLRFSLERLARSMRNKVRSRFASRAQRTESSASRFESRTR